MVCRPGTPRLDPMIRCLALLGALLLASPALLSQGEIVLPPSSVVVDGVPPVPAETAQRVRPYGEFTPHAMLSWHPLRREILVRRRHNETQQVHRVSEPGTTPIPLTDYADAVGSAEYQPGAGEHFIFSRATNGNEVYRLYRFDVATRAAAALSPEGERVASATWNRRGERVAYATQRVDRNNPERTARTTLHIVDPFKPKSDRVLARFEGGSWSGFRFSEDGRRLAFVEYVSPNESHVWVIDVATGRKARVTAQAQGETVSYLSPRFSKDGRALFLRSDRGSEFKRLVYLPLGAGKERVLTQRHRYDVDEYDVSFDANRIAFITNENGSHVLRFLDLATFDELPRPPLFQGVIGGLEWRPKSDELAFHITSARSSGDVFSYQLKSNRLTRWTNGNSPEVNTSEFAEPRLARWKSFDGIEITGLHYHPPARFTGKRPVIINVHGGPASQARAEFIGRNNYLVSELGIAILYPNVRGSSGFGKTFLKLDNGMRREDSVKDIGALLDWIGQQPDLDASRVTIIGGSYGGYMALATAVHYPDRIAGALTSVGISNFVTFLERTETYRRDLRRAEYGDERDPAMRGFLESISPLNHAERITKPLFVVQGLNDPRVPHTEAEQMVAALRKRGTPVWYLVATDEGHGFAKKPNADYLFYATVEFARKTLLQ
jgi:dipeptidyl aminopeptidase/acylaminoacyl peptidase